MTEHPAHHCTLCNAWGSFGLTAPLRPTSKTDWFCHHHYLRQPEGQAMIINRIVEMADAD